MTIHLFVNVLFIISSIHAYFEAASFKEFFLPLLLGMLVAFNVTLWLGLKFITYKRNKDHLVLQVNEALNSEAHDWYKKCFKCNSSFFNEHDQSILVRMRITHDLFELYLAKIVTFNELRWHLDILGYWWLEADIRDSLDQIQWRIIENEGRSVNLEVSVRT